MRQLVGRVPNPGHLPQAALLGQPQHGRGCVGPDHHSLRPRDGVAQAELRRPVHGAPVVAGDLVIVQVGGGEAGGRVLLGEDLQAARIDALVLEPGLVLDGILARSRQDGGRAAEEVQVVGVVGRHAAPSLLERVDEKAQVQDVRLAGQDVVGEPALEGEDVVEGDGSRRDHGHAVMVRAGPWPGPATSASGRGRGRRQAAGLPGGRLRSSPAPGRTPRPGAIRS